MTAIERQVEYEFSQRGPSKEIYEDVSDLIPLISDQVEALCADKTLKAYWDALEALLRRATYFYETYSGLEVPRDFSMYGSQQKYFYELLKGALWEKGLVAIPDLLGDYNGFRLYKARPVGQLKGLRLSTNDTMLEQFPTCQQIEVGDFLSNACLGLLKYPEYYNDLVRFLKVEQDWHKFIKPLMNPTSSFRCTPLYGQIEREVKSMPETGVEDWRVAIDVGEYPHKTGSSVHAPLAIVPQRKWFPERIRKLKAEEIVALLPQAELDVLMLIVGRALIGPSNGVPCGHTKPLKHNHRTAGVLIGRPGTGKSELLRLIDDTMTHFGFHVQPFRSLDDRFGLGQMAEAALIYKDDSSDAEISKLLHSSTVKTYCSGGMLCAEKKNKDAVYKRARGAVLLATNHFNPNNAYDNDDGIQSRLRLLETTDPTSRDAQLDSLPDGHVWQGVQSLNPDTLVKHLASKLDVDPLVVFAWFLRLCADKFYEAIPDLPRIDKTLETNLKNRIPADPLYITVKALKLALILKEQQPDDRLTAATLHCAIEGLACLMNDYRTGDALRVLKDDWERRGRQPEHVWSAMRELQYEGLRRAFKDSDRWLNGGHQLPRTNQHDKPIFEIYVKTIFAHIVTWGSIKINPSPAQLLATWNAVPNADLQKLADKARPLIPESALVMHNFGPWLWYKAYMKPDEITTARAEAMRKHKA